MPCFPFILKGLGHEITVYPENSNAVYVDVNAICPFNGSILTVGKKEINA